MWEWLSDLFSGAGDIIGPSVDAIGSTIQPELDLWNAFASSGLDSPGLDMYGDIGSAIAPTATSTIGSAGSIAPSIAGGFSGGMGDEFWDVAKGVGKGFLKGAAPALGTLALGAMKPKPKMPKFDYGLPPVGQAPSIPQYTPPPGANWSPLLRQVPKVKNSSGLQVGM